MSAAARSCPKCGSAQAPGGSGSECPRCGLVYAKYQPRTQAVRRGDEDAGAARSPLTLESSCGLAAAACAALLMAKGTVSGVKLVDALLLVPFFFCFVPVLSYTFGPGLYCWNKHRARFDLYDADEHPVLAKVFYVLFMVASVVFVIFLFRIGK